MVIGLRAPSWRTLRSSIQLAAFVATMLTYSGAAHGASRLNSIADVVVRQDASKRDGWSELIVRSEFGRASLERWVEECGGEIGRSFPAISSHEVRLPRQHLARFANGSLVKRISSNAVTSKLDAFVTEGSVVGPVWAKYDLNGAGVGVAVVDSGVSQHLDLLGNVDQVAFLKGANGSILFDDCGHGTHVAGIVAGNGALSSGRNSIQSFRGMAKGARIVSVRVLDRMGQGSVGNVLAGLQWVLENRRLKGIRVVNISLGHPAFESVSDDPLCRMVESLWKSGVVVVCAAGNDGRRESTIDLERENEGFGSNYGSVSSPGNSPFAITVGAMKDGGADRSGHRLATYSGRGPSVFDRVLKPDLVAPGNRVISLGYNGTYLNETYRSSNEVAISEYYKNSFGVGKLLNDGLSLWSGSSSSYFRMSGTSMAAPVVTGAVALMLDDNPRLSPDDVKARLMATSTKWNDQAGVSDPCSLGAGYLNVYEALKSRLYATTYALSPMLQANGKGDVWIDSSTWAKSNGIWGTGIRDIRVVWGPKAVLPTNSIYDSKNRWMLNTDVTGGTRAVWGHTVQMEGTRAVWGHNGDVDGTRAVWGHGSITCDLSSIAVHGE